MNSLPMKRRRKHFTLEIGDGLSPNEEETNLSIFKSNQIIFIASACWILSQ
jgi:hypothetical protein